MYHVSRRTTCLALLLLALTVPRGAFGEGVVRLNHERSIYADGKGVALHFPQGVAFLPDGRLVVADTGNGRLLRFPLPDVRDPGPPDVIADPRIPSPVKLASGPDGELYVLDGRKNGLFRLPPDGGPPEAWPPRGLPPGKPPSLKSFALDRRGAAVLLDAANDAVWVLDPEGNVQRRIPYPSPRGFPCDVAVDDLGTVILLDGVEARMYTAAPDASRFQPLAGSMRERVRFPARLALGPGGRIYILDSNGARLLILRGEGSFIGRQSGRGWKDGLLNQPGGLSIAPPDLLAVADTENHRVQIFTIAR